jgi:hypothetical protein
MDQLPGSKEHSFDIKGEWKSILACTVQKTSSYLEFFLNSFMLAKSLYLLEL